MTKLSIIVVVRNDISGIQITIDSIRKNFCQYLQVIVIDGNSDDGTWEYLKENTLYMDILRREIKPSGIYGAMNEGITYIKSPYHIFINSGDEFHLNINKIQLSEPCFVPVKYREIKSQKVKFWKNPKSKLYYGMPYCHQGVIFPSKQIKFNNNYKLGSDYDYFLNHKSWFEGTKVISDYGFVVFDTNGVTANLKARNKVRQDERIIIYKEFGLIFLLISEIRFLISMAYKIPTRYYSRGKL